MPKTRPPYSPEFADLVDRDFTAFRPNQLWVAASMGSVGDAYDSAAAVLARRPNAIANQQQNSKPGRH
jgi:hypothetical protein